MRKENGKDLKRKASIKKQEDERAMKYFSAVSKALLALPEKDAKRIWLASGYLIGAIK